MPLSRTFPIIIGTKGQGKSTYIKKLIDTHRKAHPEEKVLIMVSNTPPAYQKYKRLRSYEELTAFCRGTGVAMFWDDFTKTAKREEYALKFLSKHFRNGMLIVEDLTAWLPNNPPREIRDWFINHKNYGVDLVATYHTLRVPAFLRDQVTHYVLFKTIETVAYMERNATAYEQKYINWPKMFEALQDVHAQPHNPKSYIQAHKVVPTGL